MATETLTFLFTDIEGSTSLLRRVGGSTYADTLTAHRQVVRAGLAAHNGREIDTQGDAFFAVFTSPSACVAAMIEIQLGFASHEWPAAEVVRVRMGAHSGEAVDTPNGPVGIDVHRAARVAAIAHGGQSIVSGTTATLVRDSLPVGAWLRDLGSHRLKDLGRPEQIFQVQSEGLGTDFPPLRSLDNPELPNNLPDFLSAFVGREREIAEVRALVESSRLVTLTGAGGSGKTRLALQVVAELLDGSGDGVWFVDLAVVTDPERVPAAVAAALGIRGQAGHPLLDTLLDVLKEQRVLVLLDNCEHLVDACATFAERLERTCRNVRLVITSRQPLDIDGERVYRVLPLSLPGEDVDSAEDLAGSEAVELFVQRAQTHDSTFGLDDATADVVASICRKLDGIPFALELAAARLSTMSLVHLHDRLDQRFRLLTGGSRTALARQQTLQAAVDWSFDLLDEHERTVLCRLSGFVGGFELEAAEAVCAVGGIEAIDVDDLLGSLVSKSLVVAERSSGTLRYHLLETIRQYAAERLATAGSEAGRRHAQLAHAEFYLRLSETAAPELVGPRQGPWLKRLDLEWDNIRAALTYLSAEPHRTEEVLRLGVALYRFFDSRGHLEPVAQLRAALERPDPVSPSLRARALWVIGSLVAFGLGLESAAEMRTASEYAEQALEMARSLGDRGFLAEALSVASLAANADDESRRARLLGEEAVELARSVGDPRLVGWALMHLAIASPMSDPERQHALNIEALAWLRQAGDIYIASLVLLNLAWRDWDGGFAAARAHLEEGMEALDEIGALHTLVYLSSEYSFVLLVQEEFERAAQVSRTSLISSHRQGNRPLTVFMIFVLACCATHARDYPRAAQLTGAYDALHAGVVATTRGYGWSPVRERIRDDNRARLREHLSDAEFEGAYGVGTMLNYEDAIDLALGRVSSA
jgi:predicted ATPase/class 3 adenylate cyclase